MYFLFFLYLQDLAESIGKTERLEQDLKIACLEIAKYKRYEDEVCVNSRLLFTNNIL